MGSLSDRGFRFVFDKDCGWTWKHPADVLESDRDATDMDEDEFVVLVQTVGRNPRPEHKFHYD